MVVVKYKKVKRFIIKFTYPFVRIYWFLFRPKMSCAKCVIEFGNEILMVKHTYGRGGAWTFPGGGLKKGETPEEGIAREIKEEIGIALVDTKSIGSFFTNAEYSRTTVFCFTAFAINKNLEINTDEIAEARWFPKNKIPEKITVYAKQIYSLYISNSRK